MTPHEVSQVFDSGSMTEKQSLPPPFLDNQPRTPNVLQMCLWEELTKRGIYLSKWDFLRDFLTVTSMQVWSVVVKNEDIAGNQFEPKEPKEQMWNSTMNGETKD